MLRMALDANDLVPDGGKIPIHSSEISSCRVATGRSALLHLIHRLPKRIQRIVLLPSYVAEGVITPFRLAGFTVKFYQLNMDLSPSVNDVEDLLSNTDGPAVFVLIHYFGYFYRSSDLLNVLSKHESIIIDDCAQAMFTITPSGRPIIDEADLCLYSFNKFLPVVDGALLLSRHPEINLTLNEKSLPELPLNVQKSYLDHLKLVRELFLLKNNSKSLNILNGIILYYEKYYDYINSNLKLHRQSDLSLQIEDIYPYKKLIQKRIANSHFVYTNLTSKVFSFVHNNLPNGVVPWCIPVRVPQEERKNILDILFDQGVLLSTLQEKWDFIPKQNRERYYIESTFIEEHVLIPINEFIDESLIHYMVDQLNNI